jgi:glyoxylase-like metal-dependent hydrolase (beta-lactamase superfamily II)
MRSHPVADDTIILADSVEVPGLGHLPVNAFLLRAAEPLLVDTGLVASRGEFIHHLWSACDPADLRWIWLTHPDRDHTGSLLQILQDAPQARLVTTFLGLGILSLEHPIPPDRVFLLNPGQSLDIGGRTLTAFRPPLYDSPATTGLIDHRTGACFSSDCFGAPFATQELALAEDVAEAAPADLEPAQRLWATVDSPWVTGVDRGAYAATLHELAASTAGLPLVFSTHLPPARNRGDQLLTVLADAPDQPAFVGPDQAALEAMLAGFAPAAS